MNNNQHQEVWYSNDELVEELWNEFRRRNPEYPIVVRVKRFFASIGANARLLKVIKIEGNISFENKVVSINDLPEKDRISYMINYIQKHSAPSMPLIEALDKRVGSKCVYVKGSFRVKKIFYRGNDSENLIGCCRYITYWDELIWQLEYIPSEKFEYDYFSLEQENILLRKNLPSRGVPQIAIYLSGSNIRRIGYSTYDFLENMWTYHFEIIGFLVGNFIGDFYLEPIIIFRN